MKYLLEIQYDGTKYSGWQKQKNEITIQSIIEEKLKILLKTEITIFVAGRTDKGVHALQQFAHFEFANELIPFKFIYNMNALLKNETIIIKNLKKVSTDFHARFSCKMKLYTYEFIEGNIHNIFLNKRYWLVKNFDFEKANKCAQVLIGTHDFSSFRDSHCQALSPIRTINECFFEQNENSIQMKIKAQSFLHHQIRIIVGTIMFVENVDQFSEILAKKNRIYAGPTAPSCGLFLSNIWY